MTTTPEAPFVEAVLERIHDQLLADESSVEPEADPSDHPLSLDPISMARAHVRSGGKRFRPVLALWGWAYAGGDVAEPTADLVTLGAALELLHTFALIQDDVMDEAAVRRGAPTIHATMRDGHLGTASVGCPDRFGESIALLVGDVAHAVAHHLASQLPSLVRDAWHAMAVELVVGQTREVVGTATAQRSLAHTRQVALLKSGRYSIQRPLELGARLAGAGADRLGELTRYGEHLGAAFAMRDDVLGVWGSSETTGKPVGHDLRDGKATVLLALVHDELPYMARDALARAAGGALLPADVELLTRALEDAGARELAEEHVAREHALALDALSPDAPPQVLTALTDLADRVTRRDS